MQEIDLHHTNNIQDALVQLEKELFLIFKTGEYQCQVIHGIGEGILKRAVHEALQKNPLVKDFEPNEDGGSTLVLF